MASTKRQKRLVLIKVFALLSIVRWLNILLTIFAQYLAAVFILNPSKNYFDVLSNPKLHLMTFASAFIIAGGYIINSFYDLEKDLMPIAVVGVVPMVIVVNPKLPVSNIKEFISYAKANPGKVTFASSGAGAPQRLAMEMLKNATQIDILHIPYRGSGPAMTDLVGGQVVSMSETLPASQQFIESKQLRPLAVTTAYRLKPLPDVPTITESLGIPNFDVVSMFGVMAPAGTSPVIIQRISDDLKAILQKPDVQERMLAAGVFVNYMNSKDDSVKLRQEVAMWGKVIRESQITPD